MAVSGRRADGHRFFADAVERGAVAGRGRAHARRRHSTARSRSCSSPTRGLPLSALAAAFYGHPSRASAWSASPGPTARPPPRRCSGTPGAPPGSLPRRSPPWIDATGDGVIANPSRQTTPEAPELQAELAPHPRRRLHARRPRDVLARAGDAPCRRRGVPRRRVHADHHRAPRAARQPRPIPRRQGAPARARVATRRRHRRARRRRPVRVPASSSAIPVATRLTYTDEPTSTPTCAPTTSSPPPVGVRFTA